MDALTVRTVAESLRAHPEAPPSRVLRRLVAELTPAANLGCFEAALPYLCERQIDLPVVRAKLRLLAGLDGLTVGYRVWVPHLEAMLCALLHEPEAGRAFLQAGLAHADRDVIERVIGMLIAVAAPWCIATLQSASETSPHQDLLHAALTSFGLRKGTAMDGDVVAWVILTRLRIDKLSASQRRSLHDLTGDCGNN